MTRILEGFLTRLKFISVIYPYKWAKYEPVYKTLLLETRAPGLVVNQDRDEELLTSRNPTSEPYGLRVNKIRFTPNIYKWDFLLLVTLQPTLPWNI